MEGRYVAVGEVCGLDNYECCESLIPWYVQKEYLSPLASVLLNPTSPDYVPHNASVFSIADSFAYRDSGSSEIQHLKSAAADYFVIGWHSRSTDGPLGKSGKKSLRDRLASLFLQTYPMPGTKDLLDSTYATNVLVYG